MHKNAHITRMGKHRYQILGRTAGTVVVHSMAAEINHAVSNDSDNNSDLE